MEEDGGGWRRMEEVGGGWLLHCLRAHPPEIANYNIFNVNPNPAPRPPLILGAPWPLVTLLYILLHLFLLPFLPFHHSTSSPLPKTLHHTVTR